MTTDLERFVDQDGRDQADRGGSRRIDADGITFIYFQFISVTGRVMGKGIPASHWADVARKDSSWSTAPRPTCSSTGTASTSGTDPRRPSWSGSPTWRPSERLPWDHKVARVFCTLFRGREEVDDPGAFLSSDCPGNFHRLHEEFTADTGLTLRAGCEPEMMWLKTNPDGTAVGRRRDEALLLPHRQIRRAPTGDPPRHRVLHPHGLDMIQGDHEDAPGQLELNFAFGAAEDTADRLTTYRQVCRQVVENSDVPLLHAQAVHGRLGQRVSPQHFAVAGEVNMFLPDGDDPRLPSKTGLHAIGGVWPTCAR